MIDAKPTPDRAHTSPGTFSAPNGLAIDLMVPAGSLPPSSRRTASLPGQSSLTARRTEGIELALVDHSPMTIAALDPNDDRSLMVKVAGPAALVIAKLAKLAERLAGNRADRVLPKDAADLLRLLRHCDAEKIGVRIAGLGVEPATTRSVSSALAFLRRDLDGRRSELGDLAADDLDGVEPAAQVRTALRVLGGRLVASYDAAAAG